MLHSWCAIFKNQIDFMRYCFKFKRTANISRCAILHDIHFLYVLKNQFFEIHEPM